MVEQYKIIYGDKEQVHSCEISEKKSRFIAYIKKVETEQEAIKFIAEIKKKNYDASHNCSAFIVGKKKEIIRSSDDSEPQGTAGKPILDVLMGSDLVDIVCVVTRYFGGQLLGKGGLCRAYSDATKAGLEQTEKAVMCLGKRLEIHTDYNTVGKILYELTQRGLNQEESKYEADVSIIVTLAIDEVDDFTQKITEISAGKSLVDVLEETYFPKLEKWLWYEFYVL